MRKSLHRWRLVLLLCLTSCFNSADTFSQIRYQFTAVAGTYTAISGGSTLMSGTNDNNLSGATNIGFTFTYGCNTYTQFKASSNGWISLGNNTNQNMSGNSLAITGNGPIIAPLWDDLQTGSSGITYLSSGTAPNRKLVVQWNSMRWNNGANNAVITFQAILYETSNLIEFVYSQNNTSVNNGSASIGINGGFLNTDFYSVSGVNGTTVATYGTETNNISTKPNTGTIYRWTPLDMWYTSLVANQTVTSSISKCNNLQQQLIGVQVVMQGCSNPPDATEFKINMIGTSAITDVSGIHIYYTGNISAFAPIQEFGSGTITPASGTIVVPGTQELLTGTNYFWIVYDIKNNATTGNVVDAQCTQFSINGSVLTVSNPNPTGTRTIAACTNAPGGITNASLWVKSNVGAGTTNNTKVATWNDQSGNSRHASNADTDNQPTFFDNATKNLNFHPVVDFDEASQVAANADFLDIAYNGVLSDNNNPYEAYAVIVPGAGNLTTPGKFLFAGSAGFNNFNSFDVRANYAVNDSWNMNDLIVANTWAQDSILMLSFDYNNLRRETWKAGTSIGTLTAATARTSPNSNGALGYQRSGNLEFYDGAIAEIITYPNTSHGTTTRHKIESYLAIKYGVTLSHDYISSTGTTVWNRSLNAAYNNNIIGLARDNTSILLQKQARSTTGRPDILTMHIGPSLATNQANNTGGFSVTDTAFLMVGHNNDYPLNLGTPEIPAGICCRISREWLVQKTNFTNTDLKLIFDFNHYTTGYLQLNAADLRLLVDADGNFTNATILTSPTTSISASAGVVTVTVPASALNSGSYFSLGSVSYNTILPLELASFIGVCRNDQIQLKWSTTLPATNDLVVERSTDKTNFSAVATIKKAIGDQYSWTDAAPLAGTIYYRLKALNEQGLPQYSQIITVASCSARSVQLSTNPVTNASTLLLQLPQGARTEISLFDAMGRRFEVADLTGKKNLSTGVHFLPVNIPGPVAGIYTLHVLVNGERHVFRVIKK